MSICPEYNSHSTRARAQPYRPITSWGRQQWKQICLDSSDFFVKHKVLYSVCILYPVCSLHFILTVFYPSRGRGYWGKTKMVGDRNNRQTSYSFVITELKIDGQCTDQWNKCHSSVIFGCGDVLLLWRKVIQMLYRTCFECRITICTLPLCSASHIPELHT